MIQYRCGKACKPVLYTGKGGVQNNRRGRRNPVSPNLVRVRAGIADSPDFRAMAGAPTSTGVPVRGIESGGPGALACGIRESLRKGVACIWPQGV
jgi:hypothetical protein